MAKPTPEQLLQLEGFRNIASQVLFGLGIVNSNMLASIDLIPLTVLKRSATIRHGSTKWKVGMPVYGTPDEVGEISLHPELLETSWRSYGVWVMYHELIHACGYIRHDKDFRKIESCWPDKTSKGLGKYFTTYLRSKKYEWNWTCHSCNTVYLRQRRSNGRYACRNCKKTLVDVHRIPQNS